MMHQQPILRIEIERMRHQIHHMLSEHVIEADAYIKKAIDDFAKPENIERFVEIEAKAAIAQVVQEEVRWFFTAGEGRKAIREAVIAKLSKDP